LSWSTVNRQSGGAPLGTGVQAQITEASSLVVRRIPRCGGTRAPAQQIVVLVPCPPQRAKSEPQVTQLRLAKPVTWLKKENSSRWRSSDSCPSGRYKCISGLTHTLGMRTGDQAKLCRDPPEKNIPVRPTAPSALACQSHSPAEEHKRTSQKIHAVESTDKADQPRKVRKNSSGASRRKHRDPTGG